MSAARPRFAIYICDNTEQNTAYYIITKIRGVIPSKIHLNLQDVPEIFINATCSTDLPLEEKFNDPNTPISHVMDYILNIVQNNARDMTFSSVRYFVIPGGNVQPLVNEQHIVNAFMNLHVVENHHTDAKDTLRIIDRRQIVGVRFGYQPGGAARTKETTVQALKALCKKKGIRGYSGMKKAELLKALRSSR
jgi:hypothetical protein